MLERRNQSSLKPMIANGPGKMSQALGIRTAHNSEDLTGDTIWIEDRGVLLTDRDILASPRIGVDYAGDDAQLPWRFTLKGSKWVST
jgi:DNA-3-methyladenine glycosylase